jgi:hypothetical protein
MKDIYRKGNAVYSRERGLLLVEGNVRDAKQTVKLFNESAERERLQAATKKETPGNEE